MSNTITKETGTIYTNGLTQDVIDFHTDNNLTIAVVERDLTYEDKEYIDDITTDEVNAGVSKIRDFLYSTTTDNLFFKSQRGEIEKQVWEEAVALIKENNPHI